MFYVLLPLLLSVLFRTQRLEQVQKVLLEEIHKLEQDDTVLNNMEKDLTVGHPDCLSYASVCTLTQTSCV